MRLKCIKLSGFKSFVDPTTIEFPSNLCGVVGPNGCGKSNVIDAVRWVMGESSAKNLRGEQMTDVIFNGSGGRKPVGQASIELIFDNQDHKLTGEYANFSEVSVRRKVDRDAVSTYYLNGSRCRRRDITDIFLGTGLGARSYSIIEQGMVSRLIESRPEELRIYIEEAAGISKYKERRKETEARIKRTRENLARLEDIRSELGRHLQHLQRQSVAAEKYGELKQQERGTRANLNGLRWRELDAEIKKAQAAIAEHEVQVEAQIAAQRKLDADIEQHLSDNADLTDAFGKVQARYYAIGNDITRVEQSIKHHQERVEQLKSDLSETKEGFSRTRNDLDADLKRITELEAESKDLAPRLAEAQEAEAAQGAALEAAEGEQQRHQKEWEDFSRRAEEPRQTAEVEQSRIQQLERMIEHGSNRRRSLQTERDALGAGAPEKDAAAAAAARQEIKTLESQLAELQARGRDSVAELERRRAAYDEISEQQNRCRGALQQLLGRQASLQALQEAAAGEDDGEFKDWLAKRGLHQRPRLGDSMQVEAGWEAAVETVLGDALHSIPVAGSDGFKRLASALGDVPGGRLALVRGDGESDSQEAAAAGNDSDLLIHKIKSPMDLSGLLAGIQTADSLAAALRHQPQLSPGESIVTRDGVWLGPGWLRLRQGREEDSALRRRGALQEVEAEVAEQRRRSDDLDQQAAAARTGLQDLERQREQAQSMLQEKTRRLGELESALGARLAKAEEAEARRGRIAQELAELERHLAAEEASLGQARQGLQAALDHMAQDEGGREHLIKARDASRQRVDACRSEARSAKDKTHALALRRQSVDSQLQSTRKAMDRMAGQAERSKQRIESLSGQIENSDEPRQGMQKELEALLQKRLGVEKEQQEAKAAVDANEHAMRGLEQQRNGVQEKLNSIREALTELKVGSEGAVVKRQTVVEQLQEDDFDLDEVLSALPEGLQAAACEKELEKLGARIQRLGPINLAAIDEFRQQSERKEYLDQQNSDLEKALETLRNAIRKIDSETRSRFKETFDKVNNGLQTLFPRLFGGGHAYLDMTGEDLLDTGVAIMARPPGKRNSTIHLLSGGEKALTAIALVFAIFHLNPAPFCLLDEVDAPLDDTNVGRFADLVKEMAQYVQFVIITHNKITMETARQLLGVTMQEAGVSRVVAVDIDQAAELAAS